MTDSRQGEYTHGYHTSVLRSHANRGIENSAAYLAPYLADGMRLLDVGSGIGTLTADFAERMGAHQVTAFDRTAEAINLTQNTLKQRGMDNVTCVVGDAHTMPFADESFDVVHAHQVLQHVSDPVQVLREMKRVCRIGGMVAARDSDYGGFVWYPQSATLDRWMELYQRANCANGGQPNAGRHLLGWAHQAGFTDVRSSSSTWCYATPDTRAWWGGMWADRILHSDIADQLLDAGFTTSAELQEISEAWRAWAKCGDGWFSLLHGEIVCIK